MLRRGGGLGGSSRGGSNIPASTSSVVSAGGGGGALPSITKKRSESTLTSSLPSHTNNITKEKSNNKLTAQSSPPPSDAGSEETDISSSEGDDLSWISWFCGLRGNELLCEVDEDYIQDDFNLCGLQGQVPYYDHALDMILDNDSLSVEVDGDQHSETESAAELLYGLIHARYILTSKGLNAMHEKYKRVDFGRCARVSCGGQPCLPVGTSDIPRNGSVKIYCPKCEDLYFPRCKYQSTSIAVGTIIFLGGDINMDGAYVGTTFPHLYLMTYPSAKPAKLVQSYVPRVYGFKIHKGGK